jgi:uncharacterized repeat protein (TIGR03803 family)
MLWHKLRQPVNRAITIAVLTLTTAGATSAAAKEKVLHTFAGGSDGLFPQSALILDNAGNVYGTTPGGGAYGDGTVFQLTPSGDGWTETILYSFTGGSDGDGPTGPLVWGEKGNLFEVTRGEVPRTPARFSNCPLLLVEAGPRVLCTHLVAAATVVTQQP